MFKFNGHAVLAAVCLALLAEGTVRAQGQSGSGVRAETGVKVSTVAAGLENPWAVGLLPDGRFLVTERPGRLRVVTLDGTLGLPVAGLPPVAAGR